MTGEKVMVKTRALPSCSRQEPQAPAPQGVNRKPPPGGVAPQAGMQLFDSSGARKYLTVSERTAFLKVAERAPRDVRTLAMTLAWSGCRLSEALALTADRVDLVGGVLVFESLKKRQDGIYRAVPVPPALLEALDLVHGVREAQARRDRGRSLRLWPVARMTGWRMVHRVMTEAGLSGPAASPG